MFIYGIAGKPLGHSLSPLLHNRALAGAGVRGVYTVWPLGPERLPAFFGAVRALPVRGVSLTIPLKEAALPLADGLTARARAVGAINTLFWKNGRLIGDNTDVEGFVAPLRNCAFAGALLLGAGGAARAALAGLRELGLARVTVCARNRERAERLADAFGAGHLPWEKRGGCDADLVINATPLGMRGELEGQSPLPAAAFRDRPGHFLAYDLIYTPLVTRFLADARAAGARTLDGLAMFIGQAQAQFMLWTGKSFAGNEARGLLLRALGARP